MSRLAGLKEQYGITEAIPQPTQQEQSSRLSPLKAKYGLTEEPSLPPPVDWSAIMQSLPGGEALKRQQDFAANIEWLKENDPKAYQEARDSDRKVANYFNQYGKLSTKLKMEGLNPQQRAFYTSLGMSKKEFEEAAQDIADKDQYWQEQIADSTGTQRLRNQALRVLHWVPFIEPWLDNIAPGAKESLEHTVRYIDEQGKVSEKIGQNLSRLAEVVAFVYPMVRTPMVQSFKAARTGRALKVATKGARAVTTSRQGQKLNKAMAYLRKQGIEPKIPLEVPAKIEPPLIAGLPQPKTPRVHLIQQPPPSGPSTVKSIAAEVAGTTAGHPVGPKAMLPTALAPQSEIGRRIAAGLPATQAKTATIMARPAIPEVPAQVPSAKTAATAGAGIGRPELANPLLRKETRQIMDMVDEQRKLAGLPAREHIDMWQQQAVKRLGNDKYRDVLMKKLVKGEEIIDKVDSMAAQELLNRFADSGIRNPDSGDFEQAVQMMMGWRKGGTELARSMVARRDRIAAPSERLAEYVRNNITTLPGNLQKRFDNFTTTGQPQKAQKILQTWKQDVGDMMKLWAKDNIRYDNLDQIAHSESIRHRITADIDRLVSQGGIWGAIQEHYRGALMYAPKTLERNILGGLYTPFDVMIIKPIQRAYKSILGAKTAGENLAVAHTLMSKTTWRRAFANMINTYRYEVPAFEKSIKAVHAAKDIEIYHAPAITGKTVGRLAGNIFGDPVGKITEQAVAKYGRGIRLVQRGNAAVDQYVKTIHAHTEVAAQAVQLGRARGIPARSRQMTKFVDGELANLGSKSWDNALSLGESMRVTFTSPAGKGEKALLKIREAVPPLYFNLPFVKTMTQISKQALINSPFGAGRIAYRAIESGLGGKAYRMDEFTRHMAQQTVGWLATYMLWDHVGGEDPSITGPQIFSQKDRGERQTTREIRPPQSIRIGNTWYSYRNLEPFSTVLGLSVSLIEEIQKYGNTENIPESSRRLYQKSLGLISETTFMRGLGDVMRAIQDPEIYGDDWYINIAGSWLPNVVDSAIRSQDPYIRSRQAIGEKGEKPGVVKRTLREAWPTQNIVSPPRVTFWGEDIKPYAHERPTTMFMIRMFSPLMPEEVKDDPKVKVLMMMEKYNQTVEPSKQQWFQAPGKSVNIAPVGLEAKSITEQMNEDEYYLYCKLGGLLAAQDVTDPANKWNYDKPTKQDIILLNRLMSRSRSAARSFITKSRQLRYLGYEQDADNLIEDMKNEIRRYEPTFKEIP